MKLEKEKIYTKFGKQSTITQFLEKFYSYRRSFNLYKACETFSDPECTIQQCPEGRYRSIEDVLKCVRTYYTGVSFEKLFKRLMSLRVKTEDGFIYWWPVTCYQINKTTTCLQNKKIDTITSFEDVKQKSVYSARECLKVIHINSTEDLEKHYKKLELC